MRNAMLAMLALSAAGGRHGGRPVRRRRPMIIPTASRAGASAFPATAPTAPTRSAWPRRPAAGSIATSIRASPLASSSAGVRSLPGLLIGRDHLCAMAGTGAKSFTPGVRPCAFCSHVAT